MVAFPLTSALDVDVVVLESIDSTNRFLRETPGSGSRFHVAVTTHQTAGRGRMDRVWVCRPGQALALSVAFPQGALPAPLTPDVLQLVALASGAVVADAVAQWVTESVTVKWPNDVLIGGKKVAGILGEVASDGRVIVGVGLNVSVPEGDLPTPTATSLHLHGPVDQSHVDPIAHSIVRGFLDLYPRLSGGLTGVLRDRVISRLDTLGKAVRVDFPDGESVDGIATALTDVGALVVAPTNGAKDVTVTAGDVWHLRLHDTGSVTGGYAG
jgi:BirA family biotin operon repressor/biotin-[acetyl-CoA-carboxylase] ligase